MKKNEIFTVENAKVACVRYNYYHCGTNGFIKTEDGLAFVKVVRVTFNLKSQEVVSLLTDKNGKQYARTGSYDMFDTPADYENGRKREKSSATPRDIVTMVDNKRMRDCEWIRVSDSTEDEPSYGYLQVWCFENGEAKAVPVVALSVTAYVVNEHHNKFSLEEGQIPEDFWESKEDAFSFNEYKVIDSDGEEFIEQGYNKRLKLTDEQKEAVDALTEAFKKAESLGVRFLWDRDDCGNVRAYNGNEVDCIAYCDDGRCKNGQLIDVNKVYLADTAINFYDYCGCDSYQFAMIPTPREEKAWKKEHPDEK